jgi:hypothetical protein
MGNRPKKRKRSAVGKRKSGVLKSTSPMSKSITVQGTKVTIISKGHEDYICLTDMVKGQKGGDQLIKNWLQTKNTVEFLGVWEELNNPDFNLVVFHQIRSDAGSNAFLMSVKQWIAKTGAVGIIAKAGRTPI